MTHWLTYRGRVGATPATQAEQSAYQHIAEFSSLLRRTSPSIKDNVLRYMIAQIMHETNRFKSGLYTQYNNASGIKYNNHGFAHPTNPLYGPNFASYNSLGDWAKDYIRILQMGKKPPIAATSAVDFFNRLAANGYFTQKEAAQYSKGFNNQLKYYDQVLIKSHDPATGIKDTLKGSSDPLVAAQGQQAQKQLYDGYKEPAKPKGGAVLDTAKKHPILAGVGLALAGILVIKAVNR